MIHTPAPKDTCVIGPLISLILSSSLPRAIPAPQNVAAIHFFSNGVNPSVDIVSIGIIKNLFIQSHIYLRFLAVLLH